MKLAHQEDQGQTLYRVRGGLVARGTSLHRWCIENGEDTSNARRAIAGTWKGPKGRELKVRVLAAAGVEE